MTSGIALRMWLEEQGIEVKPSFPVPPGSPSCDPGLCSECDYRREERTRLGMDPEGSGE